MTGGFFGPRGRRFLTAYGWAIVVFMILPALILVPVSFSARSAFVFPPDVLSWRWYEQLVDRPRWRDAALLSLFVAAMAALFAAVLGTLAALALARLRAPVWRSLRLLFVAPMIVPLMVLGVGFYLLFARFGLLGNVFSLVLAHTVLGLPFVVMTVSARLVSLDSRLEWAAASCGAGAARTLLRVTLPLLAPAIAAGSAFAFIFSFDEIVVAQFLTGPRLETLPRRMWEGIALGGLENTITAVSSVQLAIAVIAILAIETWRRLPTRRPAVLAMTAQGTGGPDQTPDGAGSAGGAGPRGGANRARGASIAFDGITKRYHEHVAVDDVSLTVEPGEFLTLLGPSGSGKTTLLMLTAGFITPEEGRLLVDGADVSRLPPHRRNLGVVFQNYALFPHMDVRRNVAFPLAARGISGRQADERVDRALHLVQLSRFADRRISALSGGQQQRVALARAIVFDPGALLMDEPLAALDRYLRQEMQVEIRRLQRSLGQTVIYVTHDQEEAINLSDRIGVMRDGVLQQIAAPQELYARPSNAFVAEFFGEANLLHGTVRSGALILPNGTALPLPAEGGAGEATLCVRPEVIEVGGDAPAEMTPLPGRITEVSFRGDRLRMIVDSAAGPLIVTRPITRTDAAPAPGDAVSMTWQPAMSHLITGGGGQ